MSELKIRSVKTDTVFHQEVDERIGAICSKHFSFTVTIEFDSMGDFSHLEGMSIKERNMYINELIWRRNDSIKAVIK